MATTGVSTSLQDGTTSPPWPYLLGTRPEVRKAKGVGTT